MPLRWGELGTVYRHEKAGVLHGLMRVRSFTQDDAHHFDAQENMEEELIWLLKFCVHILKSFGFSEYDVFLSTRPEKAIGDEAEAAVLVDRDHHRDDVTGLLLRPLVEGVAELHDVHTMLAEGRTHRRGGIGLAGLDLLLDAGHDFLRHELLLLTRGTREPSKSGRGSWSPPHGPCRRLSGAPLRV